jgi:hypothetical protein
MSHAVVTEIGTGFRVIGAVSLFAIRFGVGATAGTRSGIYLGTLVIAGLVVIIVVRSRQRTAEQCARGETAECGAAPVSTMVPVPAAPMALRVSRRG